MKIVTVSCDKYADTAPAFSELLYKSWPNCPHELVFVTNSKTLNVSEPVYYLKNNDMSFGWRLRQFIEKHYTDDYLLFMMSDYFVKSINTSVVAQAHELCVLPDVRHVRLRPMPHPQLHYTHPNFGQINKRARYSLSLQPGIWETQVLYDLLKDNENPWETEVQGSTRVWQVGGTFLSVKDVIMPFINYYRKGKADGIEWVRQNVSLENWPEAVQNAKDA